MSLIDPEITRFYSQSSEETRLTIGLGPLEWERNKELIARYLPSRKALIADIGGGPGHYAKWLSDIGHQVILVDPVPKHILQAEQKSKKSKNVFRCLLGEGRALPIDSNSVDVVILHGPLYHLQEQQERRQVVKEARRVLKMDGIVLGFAITHTASTLTTLHQGIVYDPPLFAMCRQELQCGEHYPPEGFPGMLTDAFFHRPSLLVKEFEETGFNVLALLAVEGMVWLDGNYFNNWSSPQKKKQMFELLAITEADQELLCLSPHIMLAAEVNQMEEGV